MPYRILHIADVHLDMAYTGLDAGSGAKRRKQLQDAFERALQLARERSVDALCIAGDLYEDGRAGPDRAEYLRRVLGNLEPMRVFISPGNHDPYTATSIYAQMTDMPANVHVFNRRRFAPVKLTDGITLWGFAHEHDVDRDPAIAPDFACEAAGTHLLLFHGSDRDRLPPGKSAVAPFTGADIERTGAHHAMAGHFHSLVQGPRHAYPGSLEPHNFAQDGRHTASLVTVEDSRVSAEFIDVNRVQFRDLTLDVAPYGDRAALAGALGSLVAPANSGGGTTYTRVRLQGEAQQTLDLDALALEEELNEHTPGITLIDESAAFDYDAVLRQGRTVHAEFVRAMQEKIAAAPEAERAAFRNALRYGMLAFAKRTIPI